MKNTVGIFIDTGDNEYQDDQIDAFRYAISYLNLNKKKLTFLQRIKLFFKNLIITKRKENEKKRNKI